MTGRAGFLGGPARPTTYPLKVALRGSQGFFSSIRPPLASERPVMTNVFTLDALREETRKQFAPFEIGLSDGTTATLSSTLRLTSKDRKAVQEALESIGGLKEDDDDNDTLEKAVEAMSKVYNVIADKPAKLLADLNDTDLQIKVALMTKVLSAWMGHTEVGEA